MPGTFFILCMTCSWSAIYKTASMNYFENLHRGEPDFWSRFLLLLWDAVVNFVQKYSLSTNLIPIYRLFSLWWFNFEPNCVQTVLLLKHFLKFWHIEFVQQSKVSEAADHFLYSYYTHCSRVKLLVEIKC